MFEKLISSSVGIVLVIIPVFVSAQTLDEMKSALEKAQMLMRVSDTHTGVVLGVSTLNCPSISRRLIVGTHGEDVTQLQTFLVGQNLLLSESVTGYFGRLTERAVQAWQSKKGLVSNGSPTTTGFGATGPRTRALIGASCDSGVPVSQTREKVYLSVYPTNRQSLKVRGSILVDNGRIGTTCFGAPNDSRAVNSINLLWGDGAITPVGKIGESGVWVVDCSTNKDAFMPEHVYPKSGTYTVSLNWGSGSTSTHVTVSDAVPTTALDVSKLVLLARKNAFGRISVIVSLTPPKDLVLNSKGLPPDMADGAIYTEYQSKIHILISDVVKDNFGEPSKLVYPDIHSLNMFKSLGFGITLNEEELLQIAKDPRVDGIGENAVNYLM